MSNGTPVPTPTAFQRLFRSQPQGGVPFSELAIGGQTTPSGQQQRLELHLAWWSSS